MPSRHSRTNEADRSGAATARSPRRSAAPSALADQRQSSMLTSDSGPLAVSACLARIPRSSGSNGAACGTSLRRNRRTRSGGIVPRKSVFVTMASKSRNGPSARRALEAMADAWRAPSPERKRRKARQKTVCRDQRQAARRDQRPDIVPPRSTGDAPVMSPPCSRSPTCLAGVGYGKDRILNGLSAHGSCRWLVRARPLPRRSGW
jgi:hypothetical protein